MKKLFLSFTIIAFSMNAAQAQLKVHSNGYISLGTTSNTANSPITINNSGFSDYYVGYYGNMNGMKFTTTPLTGTTSDCYSGDFLMFGGSTGVNNALRGWATSTKTNSNSNLPTIVGVYGYGHLGSASTGFAFGVRGHLSANRGAGVFGQSEFLTGSIVDDKYAGLFLGKTKVVGNLIVTGTIQGTMLSKSMPTGAEHVEELSPESLSITDKMAELGAIAYNHPSSELEKEIIRTSILKDESPENTDSIGIIKENKSEKNVLFEQVLSNKHYAIPVDKLEKAFPELIYTAKDGTKHINYTEMIPLLVQCIGELQAKISILTSGENVRKTPSATQVTNAMSFSKAKLYQNTPNPFSERTEIRFSLPDDAQNASVCVFDMTGKMLKQIPVTPVMQSVSVNGYELPAGMYLYSLVVGGREIDTKRMILSK